MFPVPGCVTVQLSCTCASVCLWAGCHCYHGCSCAWLWIRMESEPQTEPEGAGQRFGSQLGLSGLCQKSHVFFLFVGWIRRRRRIKIKGIRSAWHSHGHRPCCPEPTSPFPWEKQTWSHRGRGGGSIPGSLLRSMGSAPDPDHRPLAPSAGQSLPWHRGDPEGSTQCGQKVVCAVPAGWGSSSPAGTECCWRSEGAFECQAVLSASRSGHCSCKGGQGELTQPMVPSRAEPKPCQAAVISRSSAVQAEQPLDSR